MAQLLFRLGRWSFINRWKVIIAWVVLFAATVAGAGALYRDFTTEFAISGTPAIEAIYDLDEHFPGSGEMLNAASVNVVFQAPAGHTLDEPRYAGAIDQVVTYIDTHLAEKKSLDRFGNPLQVSPKLQDMLVDMETSMGLPEETARADAHNVRMVSDDRTIAYTTFDFDVPSAQAVTQDHRDVVNEALAVGRDAGLTVEAGGAGFGDPIEISGTSEVIGLAVAFIVLIVTFGSLIAAFMPILTAIIGVGMGVLGIVMINHGVNLNNITPVLAIMIGLAVGIDYSLFVLSRYRSERQRLDAPDAAGLAVGTAGSSVVFAGITVFVALAALAIAQIEFLTWMGLVAAMTVALSVCVSITLTPALLRAFGDRAFGVKVPGVGGNRSLRTGEWPAKSSWKHMQGNTLGRRWIRQVHKMPGLVIAVVVLGFGLLSLPVGQLEMALPSDSTSNTDTTQRKSADLLAEGFGPGVNSPFLIIVDATDVNPDAEPLQPLIEAQTQGNPQADRHSAAKLASFLYTVAQLNSLADVQHAQFLAVAESGDAAQVFVYPKTGPADPQTVELAHSLRAIAGQLEEATGTTVGLTGFTAVQMEITEGLGAAMGPYLAVVVGLAIVLLLIVFRSVLVPVVAGIGFLLSVGAAFGLTVLFWQNGLLGVVPTPGPLISFMPIFLIGVTFGLAMDYQIFLGTRMREHYTKNGGRPTPGSPYNGVEESVIEGFTQGARVVTAAAIIMISVFVAFIGQPLPFIQIFGFALGVSVLLDAFFVRMGLVPAAMFILGRATWWMPRWLDRLLPNIDIEGAELEKEFADRVAEPAIPRTMEFHSVAGQQFLRAQPATATTTTAVAAVDTDEFPQVAPDTAAHRLPGRHRRITDFDD